MNIDIKAIVRIFSDSIIFDWGKPFNNAENTQSIGTGFFIDDQYILTCYTITWKRKTRSSISFMFSRIGYCIIKNNRL